MWKVYKIANGKTVEAGLKNEAEAEEWIEVKKSGRDDLFAIEEMDDDEIEEWEKLKLEDGFALDDDEDDDEDVFDDDEDADDEEEGFVRIIDDIDEMD
jgi:hypothetical protein